MQRQSKDRIDQLLLIKPHMMNELLTVETDEMSEKSEDLPLVDRIQFGFSRKLSMQRQTESAECGLACLSMIASYHGYRTDIATLRKKFSLSLKGATLTHLIDISTALELVSRPIRLEIDEIAELQLPCILHWNLDHFVVLKETTKKGVVIHDPARGIRFYTFAELSKNFTGVALELFPASRFKKKVERQQVRLADMMGNVVGLKRSLLQIALLALVLEFLSLVGPFFNQWVVDQAIVTGDVDLVVTLAIGFGLLKIVTVAIEAVRGWAVIVMSTSLNVQWLANLFLHMVRLPISYFDKRQMGDVVSRFNSIHAIQNTLTNSFIGAVLDGILTVGTLILMLVYSGYLSIISIVAILLYMVLRMSFYAALMSASENAIVFDAKQQTMFMETIRGIQSIRLFAKEKERAARWLNVVVDQKNASLRTQRLNLIFQTGNRLVFGIEAILVLALGAQMVIENLFSVGMLFAFISYKGQFTSRISSLIDKYFELKMLTLQGERLADIALTAPEVDNHAFAYELATISPTIEVRNLSFRYGAVEKLVLENVNLKIEAGESVAIIGPSGCGKTTLIKILLGILTETSGRIEIGGISLKQLGIANYRKMIGTVMQEDALFAGTVSDNISFFDAGADQDWVQTCGRMAALHDEIMAMPMGYNSLVGDMGTALSGGQKQRLLLARALYCRPKILFLDEATSHLDVANEQLVTKVIQTLPLTRVIVAHRSETIAGVDRVIDLGDPARLRGQTPA